MSYNEYTNRSCRDCKNLNNNIIGCCSKGLFTYLEYKDKPSFATYGCSQYSNNNKRNIYKGDNYAV